MAITRTAWVDDDGSGTTGTVINNAVKTELYEQIDAAIAGASGARLPDTNASHHLVLGAGSDLTADRALTFTTGDAARVITLSGNPTLGDWFDQALKVASSPTFAAVTVVGAVGAATVTASGLITANGGQIAFPIAQVASAGANVLDDYEEGTFAPSVTFGGAAVGLALSASGSYVKVGQLVFFTLRVVLSAKGSSVGIARITGLPFTAAAALQSVHCSYYAGLSAATALLGYVEASATTIQLTIPGAAGITNAVETNFTNTSDCVVSGCYRAAA